MVCMCVCVCVEDLTHRILETGESKNLPDNPVSWGPGRKPITAEVWRWSAMRRYEMRWLLQEVSLGPLQLFT